MAKSLWYGGEVGYSFSNSVGRSGGWIILWNSINMEVISSFRGDGFLGIKVLWKNDIYYVVNVYSSCDIIKKKLLWQELLRLKNAFTDGEWIFGGDFNAIKDRRERKGRAVTINNIEIDLFAEFIVNSDLVDVPSKGKKFSWYSGDGRSMSRIDRFLVSNQVVNKWGVVGQIIGDRDISDHCPVWLVKDNVNWGPKPFKFNNEWFSFDSFLPFVKKEWRSMNVRGRGDYVLKEKLRLLKEKLRRWNIDVFGRIDLEVEEGVRELNMVDSRLEDVSEELRRELVEKRKEASSRIWRNMRIKENMLIQKSKVRWMKEGDANSSFFHKVMKEKRRFNHLGPLLSEGGMVESVEEIR
ncbi:uncharacterized protein LOC131657664 [Vicia villosa]|uniref:uncharacterized protein LOC131657664 n=1 Tax=Vicia villosa TaxID=3911 RepID=UPI00273C74E2|nr:uncharacterized protein LOC131657664 [Vicia villosa]